MAEGVGALDGCAVGPREGMAVGWVVGAIVGWGVGTVVGCSVAAGVGVRVGLKTVSKLITENTAVAKTQFEHGRDLKVVGDAELGVTVVGIDVDGEGVLSKGAWVVGVAGGVGAEAAGAEGVVGMLMELAHCASALDSGSTCTDSVCARARRVTAQVALCRIGAETRGERAHVGRVCAHHVWRVR